MVNINLGFGRESAIAVVDASPGGASVAIITDTRGGASALLASATSTLTLEKRTQVQASAQIATQVQEAADRASVLYKAAGHSMPIQRAYVVLHAPWSRSEVIRTGAHYEKPLRINDSHIASLAKAALSQSTLDLSRLLEASVVQIAVNGYLTPDPAGSLAHSIEVVSLASDADIAVRASVEGAVHLAFPVAEVNWRTSLRAIMSVANASHLQGDFLTIDMGAEDTHIASMHDGALEQLVVSEGTRTILSRIAGNRSADEVLGYMRMIARDACSSEACEDVKRSLATVEPELVRIFGESIAKIANQRRVPNGLILSAHPDLEE